MDVVKLILLESSKMVAWIIFVIISMWMISHLMPTMFHMERGMDLIEVIIYKLQIKFFLIVVFIIVNGYLTTKFNNAINNVLKQKLIRH